MTAEVVVAADERHAEARERQRTLFSWAEFMAEEQVEPRRRRRDEAPTLSLFEWALGREQDGELVGAER